MKDITKTPASFITFINVFRRLGIYGDDPRGKLLRFVIKVVERRRLR